MAGACSDKVEVKGVKVYLHLLKDGRIGHVDIEHPDLDALFGGTSTYASGKGGGVFIAVRKERQLSLGRLKHKVEKAEASAPRVLSMPSAVGRKAILTLVQKSFPKAESGDVVIL